MKPKFRDGWKALDRETEWIDAENVIYAKTPQGLVQAAGYAKYMIGRDGVVFYRGQQSNYPTMSPSLYRQSIKDSSGTYVNKIVSDNEKSTRSRILDLIISKLRVSDMFLRNTPDSAMEGILQHYGICTRYIDIVDNIWSALWFSCHSVNTSVHSKDIMHIVKSNKEYSYVYLLSLGKIKTISNGIYETYGNYEIVDLRTAAPSLYLRPHAQHGLVVKRVNQQLYSKSDMMNSVGLTIKIKTKNALKWIGEGELLLPSAMYPSQFFDSGYAKLMKLDLVRFYSGLLNEEIKRYKSVHKMHEVFGSVKAFSY